MEPYIRVLLVEQEPDTISAVSLFLSEIKECLLRISSSGEEALLTISEYKPYLVLFAYGLLGRDSLQVLSEMHRKFPGTYLIVSVPASNQDLFHTLMVAGANDCICKDKNYIPDLVQAAKRAFIRISEREAFQLPSMARAECFAIDDNLPDLVFTLDLNGKFIYANRAIRQLLGYEQKDVVGRTFLEFLSTKRSRLRFEKYLSRVENDVHFRSAVRLVNALGVEEEFEINCTVMEGENIYGVARKERPVEAPKEMEEMEVSDIAEEESQEVIPPRLDHYRIVTLLGAGAMGRVYKGFDEQLERFVAIKVLSRSLACSKENLQRFLQEARILANISHPNIALIYHFGNLDSLPFFCMEYLPGGSLESLLRRKGTLDPDTAVNYTQQVALGLNEALQKGVLHMDIKPSNLMLAENDRVKLVDFGLARWNHDLNQSSEKIVGTPMYIAPEQILTGEVDHRSDIYSLGITFFQMLYGFVPYCGRTVRETFEKCLEAKFPSRDSLDPAPSRLYEVICRMTAREPSDRYGNCSELIEDLERVKESSSSISVFEPSVAHKNNVRMEGLLHDRPLPEILGEISRRNFSGRLMLQWMDISKALHFRNGRIIAVLSTQEGEGFVEALQKNHYLKPKIAKQIQKASDDLYVQYSTSMNLLRQDMRREALKSERDLALQILQGLFRWEVGNFFFEEGDFPAQMGLEISIEDLLFRGVKEWMYAATIERRVFGGHCLIELLSDFQNTLLNIKPAPSDVFLLFRFEGTIPFRTLLPMSGISEEEFYRLIYLFFCLNVIKIHKLERQISSRSKKGEKMAVGHLRTHA